MISHPLCLLANFVVTGIPFCFGEFLSLNLHYGRFWQAIFGLVIFGIWIFASIWSSWLFGIPPPPPLYQRLYVLFHPVVEKLEAIWKSLIGLYFFNPLLCVWIFNNNILHLVFVINNKMKLVLKFSFFLQCSFFVSMKTFFWNLMPHPPL